jgi:polar amino acid transport system ATP-binding protein
MRGHMVSIGTQERAALVAAAAPLVSLRDVHLHFGANAILNGIDLDVRRGQAVSIIGPSGA